MFGRVLSPVNHNPNCDVNTHARFLDIHTNLITRSVTISGHFLKAHGKVASLARFVMSLHVIPPQLISYPHLT